MCAKPLRATPYAPWRTTKDLHHLLGRSQATNEALDQVEIEPGIGSPRLGKLLGIPGLRTWRVGKFPLLWCYFERGDQLDVVRLLGERQDIIAILGDELGSN